MNIQKFTNFLLHIDYSKMNDFMQERSPVADHVMRKLKGHGEQEGMLNAQAVAKWLTGLDLEHLRLVEEFIENKGK